MLALSAVGQGAIIAATFAGVFVILDGFYNNMVRAVARDDKAGLLFLHHICRWIIAGVQLLSSQESRSGIELQSLGNWLLTVCAMTCLFTCTDCCFVQARSRCTDQVKTLSEEEAALLDDDSDCTGSDELV